MKSYIDCRLSLRGMLKEEHYTRADLSLTSPLVLGERSYSFSRAPRADFSITAPESKGLRKKKVLLIALTNIIGSLAGDRIGALAKMQSSYLFLFVPSGFVSFAPYILTELSRFSLADICIYFMLGLVN